MKKAISRFVLRLIGWKIDNKMPSGIKKCVVIMAPHTSNWDFVIGWLAFASIGLNSGFLIKKEAFFFPLGALLRSLGAIPVDRKSNNNIVIQVGEMFHKAENLIFTITPEGTRSYNANWKRGFYYIAEYGKVPVALGFLDYKLKHGGIEKLIYPTGNYENDMMGIEAFYRGIHAKYPEKFNLS